MSIGGGVGDNIALGLCCSSGGTWDGGGGGGGLWVGVGVAAVEILLAALDCGVEEADVVVW